MNELLDFINKEIDTDIENYAQSIGNTPENLLKEAKKQFAPMLAMLSRQELQDAYYSLLSEYIASKVG